MSFCKGCGCKIEENDLYCQSCKTKSCQSSGENQNKERALKLFQHVKSIINEINFAETMKALKISALHPVSGGLEFVAKTQKNSVITVTIILAFLQGILGIWRINQIFSNLQAIVSDFVRNSSGVAGLSNFLKSSNLEFLSKTIIKHLIAIPYGKMFIENCAIYLIGIFVLFVFIYLGISILVKAKFTPFILFKAVLISTLPILTYELISILISYFSLFLGIVFIILGPLISIITLAIIVIKSLQIKRPLYVLCVLLIVSVSSLMALLALFMAFQNFIFSDLLNIVKATINRSQ